MDQQAAEIQSMTSILLDDSLLILSWKNCFNLVEKWLFLNILFFCLYPTIGIKNINQKKIKITSHVFISFWNDCCYYKYQRNFWWNVFILFEFLINKIIQFNQGFDRKSWYCYNNILWLKCTETVSFYFVVFLLLEEPCHILRLNFQNLFMQ